MKKSFKLYDLGATFLIIAMAVTIYCNLNAAHKAEHNRIENSQVTNPTSLEGSKPIKDFKGIGISS